MKKRQQIEILGIFISFESKSTAGGVATRRVVNQ